MQPSRWATNVMRQDKCAFENNRQKINKSEQRTAEQHKHKTKWQNMVLFD